MKKEKQKTASFMTFKNCDCLMFIPSHGLTGGIKCSCGNRQALKVIRLFLPKVESNLLANLD